MAFSGMKNDGSLTQSIYAVRRQHRGALGAATPPLRWKENLRRACLDRARQKRRDLVMRKRQLSGAHLDSAVMPAQNVVEEELRKLGVSIVSSSPLEDVHSDTAPFGISDKLPRRIVSRGAEAFLGEGGHGAGDYMEMEEDDSDSVGYVITEDDLQR